MNDQEYREAQRYLLKTRDREMKKIIGVGHREISQQFIEDLYALPGNGGSDERRMAREWFIRESPLYFRQGDYHDSLYRIERVFSSFSSPTTLELKEILEKMKPSRSR